MNENLDIDVKTLKPFTRFIYTIGELPSSYLMSMTYEEQLIWLCNYLTTTVIPTINNNAEAVREVQNLVLELQTYINNYFDNLDVQEEINNKLDDMAESGQLTDIIAQYLGLAGILAFNTVNDMKNATNLVNGSITKTLGFYNMNDLGSATYKVRNITNEDIVDEKTIISLSDESLVAELIINNNMNIEQFGAYGDGTHDDTSSIQTAINKGINIYFSKIYKTSGEINISSSCNLIGLNATFNSSINSMESLFHVLSNNVTFKGLNINVTYTNPHPTSQYGGAITIGSYYMETPLGLHDIIVKNCNIIKNISSGMTIGIFGDSHNIEIDNCYVKNFGIGMHWAGNFIAGHTPDTKESYHPYNIEIKNCFLESDIGIYGSGVYNLKISNIKFKDNTGCLQLVAGDVGEYLTTKNQLLTGIRVENCEFNDCTDHTVFIKGYGTWTGGDNLFNPLENTQIEICNCDFNDSTTNTSANLLRVDYISGLSVRNCNFNATTRLKHTNFTVIKNSIIDHCYFKAYYEPFNINGCENLTISNCKADLNQNHGFMITQSYTFSPTSTSYLVNDLKLINNKLDNAFKCIVLKNTRHAKLINNMILHSATNIDLDTDNQDMIIAGNRFSEYADHYIAGHYNIKCTNLINGIIENNYLDGSSGILVATTSSNIKVINNYMSNTYAANGVLLEIPTRTDKKVYIQGNISDKNNTITGNDYSYINYTENA